MSTSSERRRTPTDCPICFRPGIRMGTHRYECSGNHGAWDVLAEPTAPEATEPAGERRIRDEVVCARCGEKHELEFRRFNTDYGKPIREHGGFTWTHWALCPLTGEPILYNPLGVLERQALAC